MHAMYIYVDNPKTRYEHTKRKRKSKKQKALHLCIWGVCVCVCVLVAMRERERERDQWRPGGRGFNPLHSTVASSKFRGFIWSNREVTKLGFEPKT